MSPSPTSTLIIGGGIQGICTSYYLTKLATERGLTGLKVTILEGSGIAAGASGKAGGLLALDWHGASTSSLAALSYRLHSDLASQYSGTHNWGYRALTTLSISADLTSSTKSRPIKNKDHFDWLNKDILRDTSVLGSEKTTSQVHPYLFTTKLAEIAKEEQGVEIVYATAESLVRDGERFTIKATTRDDQKEITLLADGIVITAGPWTGQVISQFGLGKKAGRARNIDGSRAHSVVVKSQKELPAQALFTSIKEGKGISEPEIYNRNDGTAYACGPTDPSSLPKYASDVKIDSNATALIINQVAALSPEYLSVEKGAKIEAEQACYLPVGSGDPVIGLIEKGVWVGSGHSCWGITNGPATGLCLAEMILDGKCTSADISRLGV